MKDGGVVSRYLASVMSDDTRVDFEGGGFVFEAKDVPTARDMQGQRLGDAAQVAWDAIYGEDHYKEIAAKQYNLKWYSSQQFLFLIQITIPKWN